MRLDTLLTGMQVRIVHEAACPEDNPVLCATEPYDPYLHDQRIHWLRLDPAVTVGLGGGFQVQARVPLDVRVFRVDYAPLDGGALPPEAADIHHREHAQVGPSDGRLTVARYARAGGLVAGVGAGVSVPLGRTYPDPYALTEQGEAHEHFQMGSGTWDPVAQGDVLWMADRLGALAYGDVRLPVMENRHGYRPPRSGTVGAGPLWRVLPEAVVFGSAELRHAGHERWNGEPYGGTTAVMAAGGLTWTLSPATVLQAQARTTLWQRAGSNDDEGLRQNLVVTAGASFTLGGQAGE